MSCCDDDEPDYEMVAGSTEAALAYRTTNGRTMQVLASGTVTIALPGADEDSEPTPIAGLTNLAGVLSADAKRIFWRPVWGGGSGQMPLITERDTRFYVRWKVTYPDGFVWISKWKLLIVNP